MRPGTVQRVVLLVLFSIAGGAVSGFAAALAMKANFVVPFGLVVGSVVGVVVSPLIALMLLDRPLGAAMPMVLAPTVVTALIAGAAENLPAALLSVVVFCAASGVAALLLPAVPRVRAGHCPACGYEVLQLPRCPECGTDMGPAPAPSGGRRDRIWAAASVAVLGVALPMLLASLTAYDRWRPRTSEEWIERLGHNDMQVQWEAREALGRGDAPLLIRALSHRKAGVRRNAAWVLETVRDPAAREALTAALQDPDPLVRERAQAALKALDR